MPKHSSICPASNLEVDLTNPKKILDALHVLKSGVASHCEACKMKWKKFKEAQSASKPIKSPKPPKSYQAVYAGTGVAVLLLVCFCIARYKK